MVAILPSGPRSSRGKSGLDYNGGSDGDCTQLLVWGNGCARSRPSVPPAAFPRGRPPMGPNTRTEFRAGPRASLGPVIKCANVLKYLTYCREASALNSEEEKERGKQSPRKKKNMCGILFVALNRPLSVTCGHLISVLLLRSCVVCYPH